MRLVAMMTAATILATMLAACGGEDNRCSPGWIWNEEEGICVPQNQDGDADVADDGAGEGEGPGDPGEGVEGIDAQEPGDVEEDGEGQPCDKPCDPMVENSCDDGNVCTWEDCAPITMCCVTYDDPELTNGLACGDDLFCNGSDYCYNFECYTEPLPPECDTTNPCTDAECDEVNDVCHSTPKDNGTSCDDGLYCTGENDTCLDGYCPPVNPCPVFTGNACTHYVCYEAEPHCVEEAQADGTPCPDSDVCNGNEFCQAGACTFVEPPCFDSDPCTTDVCSGTGECAHNPIADCSPCADPTQCDDGNVCSDDYCRVVGGTVECERFWRHGCTP
jgi:hypothetical protein